MPEPQEFTIELRPANVFGSAGTHFFWVLRKPDGTIEEQLHGLPVDRNTGEENKSIRRHESVFSALPFDRERAERACREMIGAAGSKTILVAEKAGRAVGLLAATADHHFFSSAVGATCLMFYVRPSHRGGMAAVILLHSFKRWAKVHGASRLYIHVTSGLHVGRTGKMLRRLGFKQTGGNYVLGMESG